MRVLITRPLHDALTTARALTEAEHQPIICPLSEILPRAYTLPHAHPDEPITHLVLTSGNALAHLNPLDFSRYYELPLFTTGEASAKKAKGFGFQTVIWRADLNNAQALAHYILETLAADHAAEIANKPLSAPHLLYLTGRPRRHEFEMIINDAANMHKTPLTLSILESYETQYFDALPFEAIEALASPEPLAIFHTSPLAARQFVKLITEAGLAQSAAEKQHLCLSKQIADELQRLQPRFIKIAPQVSLKALSSLLTL